MKAIKLIYWRTTIDNYGDLLSPFIIRSLSGKQIIQKNFFVGNFRSHFYQLIHSIVHFDWKFRKRYLFPFERNVLGIGSILSFGNKKSSIWGSGFMYEDEICYGGTVYAIRGCHSFNKIKQQISNGHPIRLCGSIAIGDPAILLPRIIEPSKKLYTIGIIPHFSEFDFFKDKFGQSFHVIDLRSSDIKKVTEEITACKYVLSSSLHGLIVAHAYKIPALWIEYSGLEENTNGFKFRDYFSSVGIEEYCPIRDLDSLLSSAETVVSRFSYMEHFSHPVYDLTQICNQLLNAAPFQVLPRYIRK